MNEIKLTLTEEEIEKYAMDRHIGGYVQSVISVLDVNEILTARALSEDKVAEVILNIYNEAMDNCITCTDPCIENTGEEEGENCFMSPKSLSKRYAHVICTSFVCGQTLAYEYKNIEDLERMITGYMLMHVKTDKDGYISGVLDATKKIAKLFVCGHKQITVKPELLPNHLELQKDFNLDICTALKIHERIQEAIVKAYQEGGEKE